MSKILKKVPEKDMYILSFGNQSIHIDVNKFNAALNDPGIKKINLDEIKPSKANFR